MEKSYKVAIITRTQDRPIFLCRAIKSVNNQTFKDYVHLIINDAGDKADVEGVIKNFSIDTQNRIKVIHNDISNGMEAASNRAINATSSELIAIHDDDDSWHPEFLKRSVEYLDQHDEAGLVVKTDKIIEKIVNGNIVEKKRSRWMEDIKAINLYRQCIDNQMTPITFIFRRAAYNKVGPYDESLPVTGDWDFGIRFLLRYDVGFLDPGFSLANYHHREYVEGSTANNSYGGNIEKHRYYSNKLMNKYLRTELGEGRLGVGYIMSKLRYEDSRLANIASKLLPYRVVKKLKSRIQS